MRSSPFQLLAAMALVAAAPSVAGGSVFTATPRPRRSSTQPTRTQGRVAAERVLTEADNTRLREAAEKRFRKAQRQARGMGQ